MKNEFTVFPADYSKTIPAVEESVGSLIKDIV